MTVKEIKTLEQSAQKGDKKAAAQLDELGVDYQFGNNGQKVDLAQALHYYMIAAEGGNTNAMCNAANCFAVGSGTDVDAEKAFYWYKKAAEAGTVEGMTNLGGCYLNGFGTKQDSVEAIKWFTKALDAGNSGLPKTQHSLEMLTKIQETLNQIFASLSPADSKRLKQSKHTLAQYKIAGYYLEKGKYKDAISWYVQLAKDGNANATTQMMTLAEDFRHGTNGRKENLPIAYQFYSSAAECGDVNARTKVAYCIYNGIGVEKDPQQAFKLYEQLAKEGNEKAIFNLGWFNYYGKGTKKDISQSTFWFLRAAEEFENIDAMNYLTHIYGDTEGFINYSMALKWFSILVEKDSDSASEWYHKTRYDVNLCKKIYEMFEDAVSESQMPHKLQNIIEEPVSVKSLFGKPMCFFTDESCKYLMPLMFESDSWEQLPKKEAKVSIDINTFDTLFKKVACYVVEHQNGSTSQLQRTFEISYDRACKLTYQLELAGIWGPINGSKGRDVLIQDTKQLEQLLKKLQSA